MPTPSGATDDLTKAVQATYDDIIGRITAPARGLVRLGDQIQSAVSKGKDLLTAPSPSPKRDIQLPSQFKKDRRLTGGRR